MDCDHGGLHLSTSAGCADLGAAPSGERHGGVQVPAPPRKLGLLIAYTRNSVAVAMEVSQGAWKLA